MKRLIAAGCVLALGLLAPAFAEDDKKDNPAAKPAERLKQKGWEARHKLFVKRAEDSKGKGDVIFLGDSITHGWENQPKVWKEYFGEFNPINLGIGGDQTGHVLWRITEGKEIEKYDPKAAVIMIGTNNMGGHSAEQIAGGVKAIVEELKRQKPKIKILVLAIFPRSGKKIEKDAKMAKADELNTKVPATNKLLEKLADDKQVFYKDIGKEFLDKEGNLPKAIMPDYLHLSGKGYEIWGKAIKDDLAKLVK